MSKPLTVLMGPQASGKSTWAADSPEIPVLSSDGWFMVDALGKRHYIDSEGEWIKCLNG